MKNIIKLFIAGNRHICVWLTRRYPGFFGGPSYYDKFKEDINLTSAAFDEGNFLEIGGADRPFKLDNNKMVDGLDIIDAPNCSDVYRNFFSQSIEEPIPTSYDFIYSMTLLEHVPNNRLAVKNIYNSLCASGKTVHYVPSKFHPYSLLLRLIGSKGQAFLIRWVRPDAIQVSGYPAFFDHCSPSQMVSLFEEIGYKDVCVEPFYRANDYFAFFVPFFVFVSLYENICKSLDMRSAASGFILIAQKDILK